MGQEDNKCSTMGWCTQREGYKKEKLVHSTPGCKKWIKTNLKKLKRIKKEEKKKDEETIQESSNQFLPHSGELFVIGCSRRKWKAKGFRIGRDTQGQSGQGLRNIPGGAFERVSSS